MSTSMNMVKIQFMRDGVSTYIQQAAEKTAQTVRMINESRVIMLVKKQLVQ
jgi:hypothetical protein